MITGISGTCYHPHMIQTVSWGPSSFLSNVLWQIFILTVKQQQCVVVHKTRTVHGTVMPLLWTVSVLSISIETLFCMHVNSQAIDKANVLHFTAFFTNEIQSVTSPLYLTMAAFCNVVKSKGNFNKLHWPLSP